jgi:hypothetical protein
MDFDGWFDEDEFAVAEMAEAGGCDEAGEARAAREEAPPPPPLALMPPWEAGRPAAEVGVWFADDAILARDGSWPCETCCCDDNGGKAELIDWLAASDAGEADGAAVDDDEDGGALCCI